MPATYHLPAGIAGAEDLSTQDRERLRAVVLPAIGAAVPQSTPAATPPQPDRTEPSRWEQAPAGRAYAVPSYDKKGQQVGLPVGSKAGGKPEAVHERLFREATAFLGIKDGGELEQLLRAVVWYTETRTSEAFDKKLRQEGLRGFWLHISLRLVGVPRPEPSARLSADTIRMLFAPALDPHDPANPANRLTAREMFRLWEDYWILRTDRASARLKAVTERLQHRGMSAYVHNLYLFQNGARDALGPAYRVAADERDVCHLVQLADDQVLRWLVARQSTRTPVTWDEVNAHAIDKARDLIWFQEWMAPVLLGLIAAGFGPETGGAALDELPPPSVEPAAPPPEPVAPAPSVEPPPATVGPGGSIRSGGISGWARAQAIRIGLDRAMIGADTAVPAPRVAASARVTTDQTTPSVPNPAPVEAAPSVAPAPSTPAAQTPAPAANAFDQADTAALDRDFDLTPSGATIAPGQGVVTTAPEVAAGVTPAQVPVLRQVLGHSFATGPLGVLAAAWDAVARPGDAAILNAGNSRYLFGLHRNRFWRRVAANPAAAALLRNAGFTVDGGAPYLTLNGQRVTLTIDHITERQTAPNLALTAFNLRLSLSRENSVVLRLLNQLDPFR
jgi:hypothetical protein